MGAKIKAMKRLWRDVCVCQKCDIAKYTRNKVFGDGNVKSKVVLVGEAPGMDEDKAGHPFIGNAGQILRACLLAAGLKPEQLFICNILKCHPPKALDPPTGNRKPSKQETERCLPFLKRQLEIIEPRLIVALGSTAANGILGDTVKGQPMASLKGKMRRNSDFYPAPVAIHYHPQYLGYRSYDEDLEKEYIEFFKKVALWTKN